MSRHLRIISIVFLHMNVCFSLSAQSPKVSTPSGSYISVETIDSVVTALMQRHHVEGLCLGIINGDSVAYLHGYGYKNTNEKMPIDPNTCFAGASLSKALFACIVMRLVEQHLMDLDTPLCRYLPKSLPDYDAYKDLQGDERWKLITARECLDHSTGFPNLRFLNPHGTRKLEIFFEPGSKYAYSGEGIDLLQFVIETISQKKLEDLAVQIIFSPLRLKRTSFVWQQRFETDYAVGHNGHGYPIPKSRRTKAIAAGSLETSIADYAHFLAAVMEKQVISSASLHLMWSPQISIHSLHQFPTLDTAISTDDDSINLSYGLGWGLFQSDAGRVFFKEGHDNGWEHLVIGVPQQKFALLIFTNSSKGESMFRDVILQIAGLMIPWQWEGYDPNP
jgi:CubicO group peptidase (beta-lactamase class C family)